MGAVAPALPERVGEPAIGQDRQAILGDGRARHVADQVLEAIGAAGLDAHGRVQAEAVEVGAQTARAMAVLHGLRAAANSSVQGSGGRSEGGLALDGGGSEVQQDSGLLGVGAGVGIVELAEPVQQAQHAVPDVADRARDLIVGQPLGGLEVGAFLTERAGEHAIREQAVEVEVESGNLDASGRRDRGWGEFEEVLDQEFRYLESVQRELKDLDFQVFDDHFATVVGNWKLVQIDPEGRAHEQNGHCTFSLCRMSDDWKIVAQHYSPLSAEEAAAAE